MSCPPLDARDPEHLATCESCRREQSIANELRAMPLPAADESFVRSVGARVRATPEKRSWRMPVALGLSLSGALAAVLLVVRPTSPTDEFAARGGSSTPKPALSFCAWIHPRPGEPARFELQPGARIPRESGFSFEVANRSPQDTRFVLFALDARGDVHWFYPSWDGTGDPSSVPLPASSGPLALPDGVTPEAPALGVLHVVALFEQAPITVQAVEALLTSGGLEALRRAHPTAQVSEITAEFVAADPP